MHPAPVVIYADTESEWNKTGIYNENGNTKVICNHNAMSFRMHIQSSIDLGDLPLDYHYVGTDSPVVFMKQLYEIETAIYKVFCDVIYVNGSLKLTYKEEQEF